MKVLIRRADLGVDAKRGGPVFRVINGFRDLTCDHLHLAKMDEIFSSVMTTPCRNGKKVRARKRSETDADSLIHAIRRRSLGDTFRPEVVPEGAGQSILKVRGLTGRHFKNVDFDLKRGEILGFAGLVGAGRSEVMQAIVGFLKAKSGTVEMESKPWKLGDTSAAIANGCPRSASSMASSH